MVFAVGISLGSVLLETGAAAWLSAAVFDGLGITNLPVPAIIAIVGAFTILIHLGFASATSMSSALIPVFIALAVSIPELPGDGVGFVLIMQFLICFGFLLPISAPQNMLAYGTGAFTTQQFLRTGIPLTIAGGGAEILRGCAAPRRPCPSPWRDRPGSARTGSSAAAARCGRRAGGRS